MPQTILFVDEEKFVHKALKRSFRKMRDEWDMRFAVSPTDALQILDKEPIDVVVSETVYSGQNGLDFLKNVRESYPGCVRIILSGYSDQDVVVKTVDLAHQYLAKPCEDDELEATIRRAIMMKELLENEALKEALSRIDSLPTLPAIYIQLMEELGSEDASIEKIGDIISKDVGLSVKILKLINSSFFGSRRKINHPAKAVSMLGLDFVKAIVLTCGTFDKFKNVKFPGVSLDQLWNHAMLTGTFAKIIARQSGFDQTNADTAYMAGLLHDIGKLLIAAHLPDSFIKINELVSQNSMPMFEAETEVLGTTHSGIGAYLLGLWGLPDTILDAVTLHHAPEKMQHETIDPTKVVHVANAFAGAGDKISESRDNFDGLDYSYFEKAGLLADIEEWQTECAEYLNKLTYNEN